MKFFVFILAVLFSVQAMSVWTVHADDSMKKEVVNATVSRWKNYEFAFWFEGDKLRANEYSNFWIKAQTIVKTDKARPATLAQFWAELVPSGKNKHKTSKKVGVTFLERKRGQYLGVAKIAKPGTYDLNIFMDDHGIKHTVTYPVVIHP